MSVYLTLICHKKPEKLRFAAMAVDVVVFAVLNGKLSVLLGEVSRPPYYTNIEAFIGGLIETRETAEMALERHLTSKKNLKISILNSFIPLVKLNEINVIG